MSSLAWRPSPDSKMCWSTAEILSTILTGTAAWMLLACKRAGGTVLGKVLGTGVVGKEVEDSPLVSWTVGDVLHFLAGRQSERGPVMV